MPKQIQCVLLLVVVLCGFSTIAFASWDLDVPAGAGSHYLACRAQEVAVRVGPREDAESDISSDPVPGNNAMRTRAKRQPSRPDATAALLTNASGPIREPHGAFIAGYSPRLRSLPLQPLHCIFLI